MKSTRALRVISDPAAAADELKIIGETSYVNERKVDSDRGFREVVVTARPTCNRPETSVGRRPVLGVQQQSVGRWAATRPRGQSHVGASA
ncbi:hypothetical protein BN2475_310006 [Paraburkholderia ribeironis]|uniref:Uncharacterized protein n=1 Tax=Paraburkholderia ribeironis TaxID=1247936 RepID=A0A1N7S276_9BURK|nr:hypothetical protein BN2475_310006 [Paraburkholderia ribeironis]